MKTMDHVSFGRSGTTSGATVIIPGNIYNFGNRGGEFNEMTPQEPHTRKGRIRVDMEQAYR
ncbi:MAG: epimerase, partial [Roseobacter sp.]